MGPDYNNYTHEQNLKVELYLLQQHYLWKQANPRVNKEIAIDDLSDKDSEGSDQEDTWVKRVTYSKEFIK